MVVRYYEHEHREAYARIKREGLDHWNDLHEPAAGYDHFPNRTFLGTVLPQVTRDARPRVLEYGCGTGPAACYLAERGYEVHGIDLVPDAIDIARRRSAERGLRIRFEVADVCAWGEGSERYDVVLDSFCLQSIVMDDDRATVLDGVRHRLRPQGRYVLSTAVYSPDRTYGEDHYDPSNGMVWALTTDRSDDARQLGRSWYLPHRRQLSAQALRAEPEGDGFCVLEQSAAGGDVVCEIRP